MRWRWALLAGVMAATPPALVLAQARSGYLPSGTIDITQVLSPAPRVGDPRYEADRAIFKATRHWLGTPRGDMATRDVVTAGPAMMLDFSCAIGVTLTPQNAPATLRLVTKAGVDTSTQSGAGKNYFKRDRPFLIDQGQICQPAAELTGSYDYPSGHTTWGWTWGLILSRLAPDRATYIAMRARAYGESRIVCGVHNATAIESGEITAAATLAAVDAQPAFQADLAAAKSEIAALRADPATPRPDARACAAEAALVRQPIL